MITDYHNNSSHLSASTVRSGLLNTVICLFALAGGCWCVCVYICIEMYLFYSHYGVQELLTQSHYGYPALFRGYKGSTLVLARVRGHDYCLNKG